jgi:hypothetical protein
VRVWCLQALCNTQRARDAAAIKVVEDNLVTLKKVQCCERSHLGVGARLSHIHATRYTVWLCSNRSANGV